MRENIIKVGFNTALVVGRFHVLQNEHYRLITTALSLMNEDGTVVVLVGSADKSFTDRNPLPIKLRIEMIRSVFAVEIIQGKLIVMAIDDMTNENDIPEDGAWGRYLIDGFERAIGHRNIELMVFGKHEETNDIAGWFAPEDSADITEMVFSRTKNPLSATEVRQFIVDGDKASFEKNTPYKIHPFYEPLRQILLSVETGNHNEYLLQMIKDLTDEKLYDKISVVLEEHIKEGN